MASNSARPIPGPRSRPPRAARRAVLAAACAAGLVLAPGLAQAAASAEAMLKRADRTLGTPQSLRFESTGTGATFGQAGLGPRGSLGQDNQACSFFGTVDWHATDRLTAPSA